MSSEFEPVPEAQGRLDPPRRRPPTAVGAATPSPPQRPGPVRWRRAPAGVWRRLGVPAVAAGLGGALLGVFATGDLLRLVGWTAAATGTLVLALLCKATLIAPRLALWRERRWLQHQQRPGGPPPQRPSA